MQTTACLSDCNFRASAPISAAVEMNEVDTVSFERCSFRDIRLDAESVGVVQTSDGFTRLENSTFTNITAASGDAAYLWGSSFDNASTIYYTDFDTASSPKRFQIELEGQFLPLEDGDDVAWFSDTMPLLAELRQVRGKRSACKT